MGTGIVRRDGVLRSAALLFAAAVVVRLLLWAAVGRVVPISWDDQADYLARAAALVETGTIIDPETGVKSAYRDPGYLLFLAGLLRLQAGEPSIIILAQIVLSALTGVILFLTAAREAGLRAGVLTGLLFLLHLSFATYCFLVYSETLAALAGALLLFFISRWRTAGQSLTAAAAIGLSAAGLLLTRAAAGLAVAALFPIVMRRPGPARRSVVLALLLAVALPAAWCVRNWYSLGVFTLNTNGAVNLHTGNNPRTPLIHGYSIIGDSAAAAPLEGLAEVPRARRAMTLARAYLTENPARTAAAILLRLPDALELDRMFIALARRGQFPEREHRLLTLLGIACAALTTVPLILGFTSLITPGRWLRWAGIALLAGFVVAQVVTIAHPRYTMPATVLLLPAAGEMLSRPGWRPRVTRAALPVTVVLVAVWIRQFILQ